MTTDPRPDLRTAYDRKAVERDGMVYQDWKRDERLDFCSDCRTRTGRRCWNWAPDPVTTASSSSRLGWM